MYDPDYSKATLPPDSPEVLSSPIAPVSSGSSVRRKSLVGRSSSKGRRVSFQVEEEESVDTTVVSSSPVGMRTSGGDGDVLYKKGKEPLVLSSPENYEPGKSRAAVKGKGKIKALLATPTPGSESDSDLDVELPNRGRHYTRAQTPGPPTRTRSSTRAMSMERNSAAIRGRSSSVGAKGRRKKNS